MIPLHKVLVDPHAEAALATTLRSGTLTEGPRVKEFEAALETKLGCKVLATNSCTSAIDLALHLVGVGPGDEVISTPLTCAATNTHVILRGAKLVWADVGRDGCINPHDVLRKITRKTAAVIVVDWGGRPAGCAGWNAPTIQDAAHSFGATREVYQRGDYIAWSFQAIKHLTCGDGGALKVPAGQEERARRLRWFGIDRDAKAKFRFLQDIPEAGYKYHMNDLAATLGLANLEAAWDAVGKHRDNARYLHNNLQGLTGIELPSWSESSSWWFFSLLVNDPEEKDSLTAWLEEYGIGCGPIHGRNDDYSAFGKSPTPLPGVDYYVSRHIAIPCGWWCSQADLDHIVSAVREWDSK